MRFQAEFSNALWHFDMSPSDLKELASPPWLDPDRQGAPTLMLFSVVDDRSGMAYQDEAGNPFQGIPGTIQLDNGPVGKSAVFRRVMDCLGVEVIAHMPRGSDGRRTTARSKGKVERPFRTVKEAHETLYHFHQPQTEAQANVWLANFVAKCNQRDHRSEDHSRQDDWLTHLPADGLRAMCAWERFCAGPRWRRSATGPPCSSSAGCAIGSATTSTGR